jgi:hypothetical protein
VAIIGAGPVGLAAAAHLLQRGETPVIFEAGDAVGANISEWGHVRFFSPWRYSIDTASRALLEAQGWTAPDPDTYPTGQDLVARYLAPLAATPQIAPQLRLATRVVSVTRQGFDKMKSVGRDEAPFLLLLRTRVDGAEVEEALLARAVIDASGTWATPNPLGASGMPASGEAALREHIAYHIPDPLGVDRARYEGRRVLVAGSGHSAFNVLADLAELARQEPETRITWVIRREVADGQLFGGGATDALPARGALGQRVQALVAAGTLRLVTGFKVAALQRTSDGIMVTGAQHSAQYGDQHGAEVTLPPVDELIVTTGFRPDLTLTSELRLALDSATESPVALAPLIDPNVHSCGTVPPHGAVELAHPERDFYLAGMKSYGRAPTFLLLTGYEQVRSIAAALTDDWEAAREVHLALPETGVCSLGGNDGLASACCGAETPPATNGGLNDGLLADVRTPVAGLPTAPRPTSRRMGKPIGVLVRAAETSTTSPIPPERGAPCCE